MTVTETSIVTAGKGVRLHHRGVRPFGIFAMHVIRETFHRAIWTLVVRAATLGMVHPRQDQRSRILRSLAPVPRTVAVGSDEAEAEENLAGEEDHFIMTTGTDIMTPETAHQIARTDHAAGRPCAEIVTCETNEISTGETVMTAGSRENTIPI